MEIRDSKKIIIEFLSKNPDKEFTITDLFRKLEISVPTLSKYVDVLKAEGLIEVKEFSNMKLIKIKR